MFIQRLCLHCKKLVADGEYRYYYDDVNQITHYLHYPDCWEAIKKDVVEEYVWLIFRCSQPLRRVK